MPKPQLTLEKIEDRSYREIEEEKDVLVRKIEFNSDSDEKVDYIESVNKEEGKIM